MKEIVGIRFKKNGKVYYFSPEGVNFDIGQFAVVDTARGMECGEVVIANRKIDDSELNSPLKPIIRKADSKDIQTVIQNRKKKRTLLKSVRRK